MKKSIVLMIGLVLTLGFSGSVSAITDPGTNYGPVDLTEAEAAIYDRGDVTLVKLSIAATPNLPGTIIFEVDVDNSTGTGGSSSTLGAPVAPCPCKTQPGMDIAVSIYTRTQGDSSGSAFAASCTDNQGACGRRRESGEWYAIASLGGQPIRALGVLRGLIDPLPASPTSGATEDCYTIPLSYITAYANQFHQENPPAEGIPFSFQRVLENGYLDAKWQVSVWYDADAPTTDEDDVSTGDFPAVTFDINDFAPDVGTADMVDGGNATALTYCEGNFDGDKDVDGGDAAAFKANFGRSPFKNPCPGCGPNY
jgi:hypothetical protein